jgi:putative transposase
LARVASYIVPGYCYHLINRGNLRARVFHEDADYRQFLALIHRAQTRIELPILAMCLMPNHLHLVVQPRDAQDVSRWMQWVFTTHVHWSHAKYGTTGRLWQGRFKAFLCQADHHLLTVMRYVERNALRANLVERAEDWRWGSLAWRGARAAPVAIAVPPVALPSYWRHSVNEAQSAAEVMAIRRCVNRQCPFGDEEWVNARASELGMQHSLAPIGRPRRTRSVPVC